MITEIPFDYMHNICLGVIRRLVWFWVKGPVKVRLPPDVIESLSRELTNLKEFIPSEFARKPRPVSDIERWKATEGRQFLLYTVMVILKGKLSDRYYKHFLALMISIRFLADQKFSTNRNKVNYAKRLIDWFIETYKDLYGEQYISHNVHSISHLPDNVNNFGCLDNFSAFKFENEMQKLKH